MSMSVRGTSPVYNPFQTFADAVMPPPPLSENAKGFLTTLEQSSEEELTLHLQDRMQFSKEAIACLVCVFDRLHSRINDMCKVVQDAGNYGSTLGNDTSIYVKPLALIDRKESAISSAHCIPHSN